MGLWRPLFGYCHSIQTCFFVWGCASPVRAALFPQVLLVFGLSFSLSLYIGVPLCLLKLSASASVCLSVALSLSVCVCVSRSLSLYINTSIYACLYRFMYINFLLSLPLSTSAPLHAFRMVLLVCLYKLLVWKTPQPFVNVHEADKIVEVLL